MNTLSPSTTTGDQSPPQILTLKREHELRIEVDFDKTVLVKVLSGTAEIFGCELAVSRQYSFKGTKLAIFTWHGCQIEMIGEPDVMYIADETPMIPYLNTHLALEHLRRKDPRGPRILIVGPTDVGKSTIAKTLLNYAVRHGHSPMYVDLDMGQGALAVPGCVCAASLDRTIDPEDGWHALIPIVYDVAHASPGDNIKLYRKLTKKLASVVDDKMKSDKHIQSSGMIVNSCGWIDNAGYDLLLDAIQLYNINVVLVIGHDRLFNDLLRDAAKLSIVKLPKSGGVVSRSPDYRRRSRMRRIHDYFYGPKNDLSPYTLNIPLEQLHVYRFGEGPMAPSSALPIGANRKVDETKPVKVFPLTASHLLHSILGLLHLSDEQVALLEINDDNYSLLREANCAGFVYVVDIDEKLRRATLLTPYPGKLPRKHLILGSVKWYEQN